MNLQLFEEFLRCAFPIFTNDFSNNASISNANIDLINKTIEFDTTNQDLINLPINDEIIITNAKFVILHEVLALPQVYNTKPYYDKTIIEVELKHINKDLRKNLQVEIKNADNSFYNGIHKIHSVRIEKRNNIDKQIIEIIVEGRGTKKPPELKSFILITDFQQYIRGVNGRKEIQSRNNTKFTIKIDDIFNFDISNMSLYTNDIKIHWNIRVNAGDLSRFESSRLLDSNQTQSYLLITLPTQRNQVPFESTTDNYDLNGGIAFIKETYEFQFYIFSKLENDEKKQEQAQYIGRVAGDKSQELLKVLKKIVYNFKLNANNEVGRTSGIEISNVEHILENGFMKTVCDANYNTDFFMSGATMFDNDFVVFNNIIMSIKSNDSNIMNINIL